MQILQILQNPYSNDIFLFLERNLNSIVAIFIGILTIIVNIIIFRGQLKHNIKVLKQESINRYKIEINQKWIDEMISNISLLIAIMHRLSMVIKGIEFRLINKGELPNEKNKIADEKDIEDFKQIDNLLYEYRRVENIIKFNLIKSDDENRVITDTLQEYYDLISRLTDKNTPNDEIGPLNEKINTLNKKLVDSIHKLITQHRDNILK